MLPRNDVLAVRYLAAATDKGDATAAMNLGTLCELGRGGPAARNKPTPNGALHYIQVAAEGGNHRAQVRLGKLLKVGTTEMPQDMKMARKWFRLAARGGDPQAAVELGKMYLDGDGVPVNGKVALRHFRAAAEAGNEGGNGGLAGGSMTS